MTTELKHAPTCDTWIDHNERCTCALTERRAIAAAQQHVEQMRTAIAPIIRARHSLATLSTEEWVPASVVAWLTVVCKQIDALEKVAKTPSALTLCAKCGKTRDQHVMGESGQLGGEWCNARNDNFDIWTEPA